MSPKQRTALATPTDLKPVFGRKVAKAGWEQLNLAVQAKLEQTMYRTVMQSSDIGRVSDAQPFANQQAARRHQAEKGLEESHEEESHEVVRLGKAAEFMPSNFCFTRLSY